MINYKKPMFVDTVISSFGYKWLQFLELKKRTKAIAVYIYIIYNIIICNHVTTVTKKTIYTWEIYFFSYTYIQFWWLRWLHGYKQATDSVFGVFFSGYNLVTSGNIGGYND